VQAGVVNADLVERAGRYGLTYAPDPSSQSACTLGGNVAENSGGPHCLKYGVTSRYVTALRVVGAGGEVLDLGPDPTGRGPDLVGLFVGSEGCFGLATEIQLALVPRSEAVRTLLATFPRPEEAGSAVSAIIAAGLLPAALEIVDGSTIRAVEASIFAAGYPVDAGAALVVEFDGPEPGLDEELDRAAAFCVEAGATEIRRASGDLERAALWKGRKKAFGAMGRLAPDLLVQDATVPRSRLPEVLRRVDAIARGHGLAVANVFHAGDGNLHPNLLFDRRNPEQVARVELASREIMEACVAAGGTITGEHGVGLDKRAYMHLVHGPAELDMMDRVRRVFDPLGRWNPGKVLPDREGDERRESSPGSGAPGIGERTEGDPADDPQARGSVRPTGWQDAVRGDGCEVWEGEAVLAGESPLDPSWWRRRTELGRPPPPLALPADEPALRRVLGRAAAARMRVLAAGSGTALPSAADVDLVVGVARLATVVEYEPADLTVTVGSGIPLEVVQGRLARSGQWLAIDGPGLDRASIGAVVSTGDAVALATSCGAVRDQVLGLRIVTGDGVALRLGGRVVKNVAGFDLVRLLVGGSGAFGVITEVTLRTQPLPAADHTLLLEDGTPEDLLPPARAAVTAPLQPASVELCGDGAGARLLVRVFGSEAAVEHTVRVLDRRLGRGARLVDESRAQVVRAEARRALGPEDRVERQVGDPSAGGIRSLLARARFGVGENEGRPLRAWPDRGVLELGTRSGSEDREGRLRAERGGPVDRPRRRGVPQRRLAEGLRRAFDPRSVLVGGAE
jgi:glycolate oxidase subunit GlcD